MSRTLAFGLHTFGDVTVDADGTLLSHASVIRNVLEQAVLAEDVGVDLIGVGEHHRSDFAISAPDIVLSAIAARTRNIRLTTAVTVLSSDDPVRLYERFATLDAIASGRAEITLGRGSFIESFPLFGYALDDYNVLFEEKLALFARLRQENAVSWQGTTRAALQHQSVYPRTAHATGLPTWIGVGGTPESVVRAAHYGFPLAIAIIGGNPARFTSLVQLYRQQLAAQGKADLPVSVHSFGHIADTDEQAKNDFWPHYQQLMTRMAKERGGSPPTRQYMEQEIAYGSVYVGSPETVAHKIANTIRTLGIDQFDMKYSNGTLPHTSMMTSIALYGNKVIPMVRELLQDKV